MNESMDKLANLSYIFGEGLAGLGVALVVAGVKMSWRNRARQAAATSLP